MAIVTTTLALGPEWLQPDTIIAWLGPWALVGLAAIIFASADGCWLGGVLVPLAALALIAVGATRDAATSCVSSGSFRLS